MRRELLAGVRIALKRWRSVGAVALIFAMACLVLALVLSDVLVQWTALRAGSRLRQEQATIFSTYYGNLGVTNVSTRTRDILAQDIAVGRAYTSVIYNVSSQAPDFADGVPAIVIVGDLAPEVLPGLSLCGSPPCATLGPRASSHPTAVDLHGLQVPVVGKHPAGMNWFDPHAAGKNLEDHLVIRIAPEQLTYLDEFELEEAVSRTVYIGRSAPQVEVLVQNTAGDNLYLVPQQLSLQQPKQFKSLMVAAGMYIVAISAFCLLTGYAFSATSRAIVDHEMPELAIRRTCGATPTMISLRLAGFTGCVMLVLPLLMCGLLLLFGYPVNGGARVAAVCVLACFGVVFWSARRYLLRKDGLAL